MRCCALLWLYIDWFSHIHQAYKATLMNMDKYFMWIHYERLHNHNKAKHNKTVRIFLGIYCMRPQAMIPNDTGNVSIGGPGRIPNLHNGLWSVRRQQAIII